MFILLESPVFYSQKLINQKKVQYEWALNEQNKLIHVNWINKKKSENQMLFCPECKDDLVPVKGTKKNHHFRHKTAPCTYEQYLHTSAMTRIFELFNQNKNNLPPISFKCRKCKVICSAEIPDLTYVVREFSDPRLDNRRIDIMFLNSNMKPQLGIEVYNTHTVPKAKELILKNLQIPIYELSAKIILKEPITTWLSLKYWNQDHLDCEFASKLFNR